MWHFDGCKRAHFNGFTLLYKDREREFAHQHVCLSAHCLTAGTEREKREVDRRREEQQSSRETEKESMSTLEFH